MESLSCLLSEFSSISLEEMDSVKLLNRADTKFAFHDTKLPLMLDEIKDKYYVLETANNRVSRYETLYFDSENFDFYLRHHNQKLNRYKVRLRKYVNSNLVFFEVKYKSNKDRTIKDRVKRDDAGYLITGNAKDLYEEITALKAEHLLPKLWVDFSRVTLVNKNFDERLTIDSKIVFRNNIESKSLNHLIIAEVKQQKASSRSPFIRMMAKYHIQPESISKYCLGVIQLYPVVKTNNFKPKLLTIHKILNAHDNR